MISFILYTPFLHCTEFYIALAQNTHKYLTGNKHENVHTTEDVSLADTFMLTINLHSKGWHYINVVGKNLVFDINSKEVKSSKNHPSSNVLIYSETDPKLKRKQGFHFILLKNLEHAVKNTSGQCLTYLEDRSIFIGSRCNYDKNINQRFKLITKDGLLKTISAGKNKNKILSSKVSPNKDTIDKQNQEVDNVLKNN